METDYVQVPRTVKTPITTYEAVTVQKPEVVMEDTIVQQPKTITQQQVVQKQVTVKVRAAIVVLEGQLWSVVSVYQTGLHKGTRQEAASAHAAWCLRMRPGSSGNFCRNLL
jgi:NaMN:DMB phosphoribosyltransferase